MDEQVTLKKLSEHIALLDKLYPDAIVIGASLNCYDGKATISIHIEEHGQPHTIRLPCHIK